MTQVEDREVLSLNPPNGMNQLVARFGDILAYIGEDHTLDPRWNSEMLSTLFLPFPLTLAWDRSRLVTRITCHKILQPVFHQCFENIAKLGLKQHLSTFGGCFCFRPQRNGIRLSTHSWGIAIDLNPDTNAQGTVGSMHPEIVRVFRDAGFAWGGNWKGTACDPMHFQFCTGY